ncbi:MAG: hypothetical protein H6741_21625 [Alphaproteobacteria bacterium]|nr:hypothetical protein [Alphaproteobacteria bacterium]MCB9795312.1 hypothetical protein [Alphaproteobacteria bacterium]
MADFPIDGGGSLRSLLTRARAGDRLLLGPGDWELDERLPRGVEIAGEPGARLHGAMRVVVDGVVLRGLTLLPQGELELKMGTLRLEGCTLRGGAFVSAGGRLELIGGRIEDPPQEALAVQGATVHAQDLEILRARQAAVAAQDAEITLLDCVIRELDGNALDLVGGCEVRLEGCEIEARQAAFPLIWAEASAVTASECKLRAAGAAVQLAAGATARLSLCEISQLAGEGGVGLRVMKGTLTLSTCAIRGCWGAGLWVDAQGEAELERCVLEGNERYRPASERSELFVAPGGQLRLRDTQLSRFQGEPLTLDGPEAAAALARRGLDGQDLQALLLGLGAGAPLDLRGAAGRSVAHGLARAGDHRSLRRLHAAGLSLSAADARGRPALHEAQDARTIEALLELGTELFTQDAQGGMALHSRAELPEGEDALRALTLGGLCPDLPDAEGARPLDRALLAEQPDNVLALVQLGADPDHLLPDGRLPVSVYAEARDQRVVDELLEWGADPVRLDAKGRKPRYYADPHRVFRRTFKRLRHDPWPVPPAYESLRRLGLDSPAEDPVAALAEAGALNTPALRLELGEALPWSALVPGAEGESPLRPVGEDPFGREALLIRGRGAFLCLRRRDLRALLAAGRAQVGEDPRAWVGFLIQEVATLSFADVLGLLSVLGKRRELEQALGSMRKRVTRARVRRGLDFMRPWLPDARANWEPRLPEARARMAQLFRDLGGDEVPEVPYHPLALRAAMGLADPVHPLAHEWLDHTRVYAELGGLKGWAALARERPLSPRRLWGEEDTRALPLLELARDEAGCTWLHLGTGGAARLSTAEREDPEILDRLDWAEDLTALLS